MVLAASACVESASRYCFYSSLVCPIPFGLSFSKPWRAGLGGVLVLRAEAGLSPRRASNFLLLRQKKVTKEKATPSLRPLRFATGQTCVGAVAGCAVELALRCARRSDNHGESVHEAWALRRPCSPRNRPAAGAASRGLDIRTSNSRTATRAIAALGPACAARGACAREMGPSAAMARVDVRFAGSLLYAPGARRARGGMCAEGHTCFVN